jgi:AcrR family transcriptional regulator
MNVTAAPPRDDPRVERSREVIRQAVLEELAAFGYGKLSIEAVARRAGVGKSTIYRHWNDKVDLVADAFENAHREMVPDLGPGSARARVILLVGHVAAVVTDSLFSRCIPALIDGSERDARLREFAHDYAARRRAELAAVIADGVTSGEFEDSVDPTAVAVAVLGTIFYRRLLTPAPVAPAEAPALLDALLPRAGPARRRRPRPPRRPTS